MKFFRFRNPPAVVVIALIILLSIGAGFFVDFLCTLVEKNLYPQDYSEYVEAAARRYGVPTEVVYAVIRCESGFDSGAVSAAGAVGLMQLMPDTFAWLTDEILFEHLESGMMYDPETNVRYGTCLLGRLYDRYGDWETAFAAYNAGAGRVDQWLKDSDCVDENGHLKRIPFRETRRYVKKASKALRMYEKLYGADQPSETPGTVQPVQP